MRIGIRGNGYRLLASTEATDSIRCSRSTCTLRRMLLTGWHGICFTRWRVMGRSWKANRFFLGDLLALVDYLCRSARLRIDYLFYSVKHNVDRRGYKLAQRVLSGELGWLESG